MQRIPIPFEQFCLPVVDAFGSRWMLLTAGTFAPGAFNTMTVSWGGLGVIWNKPTAMVVVRPSRHTYTLMESGDTFTLCTLPSEHRDALTLCGTQSGRAIDKAKAAGLTPIASTAVAAPAFEEAELIIECRKTYFDDIKPAHFLAPDIEANYSGRDYHRMYLGEILAIHGIPSYRR